MYIQKRNLHTHTHIHIHTNNKKKTWKKNLKKIREKSSRPRKHNFSSIKVEMIMTTEQLIGRYNIAEMNWGCFFFADVSSKQKREKKSKHDDNNNNERTNE